jgi:hypothetical protein
VTAFFSTGNNETMPEKEGGEVVVTFREKVPLSFLFLFFFNRASPN